MNHQEKPQGPALYVLASTVIFGLASFIIWILRIAPGSRKSETEIHPTDRLSQASSDAREYSSETLLSSAGAGSEDSQYVSAEMQTDLPVSRSSERKPASSQRPPDSALDRASARNAGSPTHWTVTTRYIAAVGIILFVLWLIAYSQQTLTLLVFAALIAILARPAIHFLQKRLHFSTGLAVLIIYLLVALLLVAIPLVIVPNVITGMNSLVNFNWEGILQGVTAALNRLSAQVDAIPIIGAELAKTLESISGMGEDLMSGSQQIMPANDSIPIVISGIGQTLGFLVSLLGPLVSGILSLVFMLLISMQMSLAGGQIRGWIINPVPDRFKAEIESLLDRLLLVWVSFLHGQFSLMVVMGFLVWLMNLMLGTPQAILLGVLSGLLEVIPSLGPVLATIPAAIFALMFGSNSFPGMNHVVFMIIVIVGYVLLNLVENQVLVPRILGDAVSLPPLIVLIGVTIAGAAAGIVGVFLATPIMASGREILNYVYEKIIEAPEQEKQIEEKPSLLEQLRGFVGHIRLPFRRTNQGDTASPLTTDTKI